MSSDIIIACRGVSKSFQTYDRPFQRLVHLLTGRQFRSGEQFLALDKISLQIMRGESVAIIGTNGSGKSTLLQLITGILQPTSGQIQVSARIAALLELGAGFNIDFTGCENIYLNGALMGLTRSEIEKRYDDIVAFADIGEHINLPVKSYSSGMYVRLAFAIAAHVNADTLVIDEALSVGDVRFSQKCMRFLRKFKESGNLLFVSHDAAAVVNLCDRAIWLDRGCVRMDGSAKEVVECYLAEQHALDRAAQGEVVSTKIFSERTAHQSDDAKDVRDAIMINEVDSRQELIDQSKARNLIEIFEFSDDVAGFGGGGARIVDVTLRGTRGRPQSLMLGGEVVTIVIGFEAIRRLESPIIGFYVKDRLGQRLFGDNTYLSYRDRPMHFEQGSRGTALFTFRMPMMPSGDYSIDVALATGTQDDHTQQHWVHDALVFRASDESMRSGLVGIPMRDISIVMSPER